MTYIEPLYESSSISSKLKTVRKNMVGARGRVYISSGDAEKEKIQGLEIAVSIQDKDDREACSRDTHDRYLRMKRMEEAYDILDAVLKQIDTVLEQVENMEAEKLNRQMKGTT